MTPNMPVVYLPGIDGTGKLLYRQERLNAEFSVRCVSYPQDDTHAYADLVHLGICALEETDREWYSRNPSVARSR